MQETILKALLKAKLLRCGHERHMEHKSVYTLLLFLLFREALTQQRVSDMKIYSGETWIHIKGNETDWMCRTKQQHSRPRGRHWWPFGWQHWSGGYCVALKWQGCEVTDEGVNTQGVKMLRMQKKREREKSAVTWVLDSQEQCILSWNLRNVSTHVKVVSRYSCASLFSKLATMTYLMLSAAEDLQMKDNDLRSVKNKMAMAVKDN